jgi:CheY-like chemotaxis protein
MGQKRILVVDDEDVLRELLADILADEGHQVDTACDGLEALDWLDQHHYDAVFIDLQMPGLEAAVQMVTVLPRQVTLGADKGYDTREFVKALRALAVTPHVAQNTSNRASGIDGRTTRHPGYLVSQQKRKLVEEIFGWLKTVGRLRKTRHRGERRVDWIFTFAAAVYHLVRIRNLTSQGT